MSKFELLTLAYNLSVQYRNKNKCTRLNKMRYEMKIEEAAVIV